MRSRLPIDIHKLASTRGVKISYDADEAYAESLEFRKMGRHGSHAAALLYAGQRGHAAACLLLAGYFMTQASKPATPNKRTACARAFGWLCTMDSRNYARELGIIVNDLESAMKAKSTSGHEQVSPRQRDLDRREGKLTVLSKRIGKLKFENADGGRYERLNMGLSFKGPVTLETCRAIMDGLRYEYPWTLNLHAEISNRLELLVATGEKWLRLPPILLVGPPGMGKTRLARRIAELASVPLEKVSFGGSADNRDFAGTSRGWSSATPTRISEIFVDTETPNPLVLLDEVDKASSSDRNGNVIASVLTMLAPETQTKFRDEALSAELDLSYVNWIATANTLDGLKQPFLSRMRIVKIPAPPPEAAERLIEVALKEFIASRGWDPDVFPPIEPIVHRSLQSALRAGASPRALSVMIEQVMSIALKGLRAQAH